MKKIDYFINGYAQSFLTECLRECNKSFMNYLEVNLTDFKLLQLYKNHWSLYGNWFFSHKIYPATVLPSSFPPLLSKPSSKSKFYKGTSSLELIISRFFILCIMSVCALVPISFKKSCSDYGLARHWSMSFAECHLKSFGVK